MVGRVPLPQGFADSGGNASDDEYALRGDDVTAEAGTVRDLRFSLGEIGNVNVVEDGKARQVRGWISGDGGRNREDDEKEKREKAHVSLTAAKRKSFTSFHLEEGTSIP
jgi:hypothetical protein